MTAYSGTVLVYNFEVLECYSTTFQTDLYFFTPLISLTLQINISLGANTAKIFIVSSKWELLGPESHIFLTEVDKSAIVVKQFHPVSIEANQFYELSRIR